MAPNSQYGSAETVEVLGIVQSPGVLQELSHVDYDQPINKPFSAFPSLQCCQDVLISYNLAPVSRWQHCYKSGAILLTNVEVVVKLRLCILFLNAFCA